MLTNQGSILTPYDGTNPPINPLATQQSQMHADASGTPGYSLNGNSFGNVNGAYQAYLDGVGNILPQPSILDLNGAAPTITPGGQALPYVDNLPE